VTVARTATQAEREAMWRLAEAERAASEAREQLLAVMRREALRERTARCVSELERDGDATPAA